jgi:hypothetical protein
MLDPEFALVDRLSLVLLPGTASLYFSNYSSLAYRQKPFHKELPHTEVPHAAQNIFTPLPSKLQIQRSSNTVSHVRMPLCAYNALEQHQMRKRRLQCQNCDRLLCTESGLEQHRQAVHSGLSLTYDKDSTRKESLRLHCGECDRFFLL